MICSKFTATRHSPILIMLDDGDTERLANPFDIDENGGTLSVTMSIGVATGPAGDIGLTDLLERADQALYAAKNGGRNRVEVADDLPAEPDPLPEAARA